MASLNTSCFASENTRQEREGGVYVCEREVTREESEGKTILPHTNLLLFITTLFYPVLYYITLYYTKLQTLILIYD